MENIVFLLNQFIKCSAYKNIVFCWVMHEQGIINNILEGLSPCNVKSISLIASPCSLKQRLEKDVEEGKRDGDVFARSLERLKLYDKLNTIKIDTDNKNVEEIANLIAKL